MLEGRLSLHDELCNILGTRYAYFQPPASVSMKYPAIKYSYSNNRINHANNGIYRSMDAYELIVIDKNPESEIPNKLSKLSYCKFDRFYIADNLNHWVFTIYH